MITCHIIIANTALNSRFSILSPDFFKFAIALFNSLLNIMTESSMSSSGSQKKGLKLDHSVLGIYHQEAPWDWVGEWLGMEEKGWVGVHDCEGMEGNHSVSNGERAKCS